MKLEKTVIDDHTKLMLHSEREKLMYNNSLLGITTEFIFPLLTRQLKIKKCKVSRYDVRNFEHRSLFSRFACL